MNNRSACDHKQVPRTSFLWLFVAGVILTACSNAGQRTTRNTVPFADLFTIRVDTAGGEPYLLLQPDSTPGDSQLNARCSALWYDHLYLFDNYAKVFDEDQQLLAILPDTIAMRKQFHASLTADTAFQRIYMRSIEPQEMEPLPLDSALRITAHFFYLHRLHGNPTMHICTGINKVKEMSEAVDHPYYAAFGYMVIRDMEDPDALFYQAMKPFDDELKVNPSDERLIEMQHAVYNTLAHSPELRKALLDTYEQKAQYLNFKLVK